MATGDSRSSPVRSAQTAAHPGLRAVVRRHLEASFQRPVAAHGHEAVARLLAFVGDGPYWLDAGCGTGESTAKLARRSGGVPVVGIDKSAARLGRGVVLPDNALCLRADLVDVWRLLAAAERPPQAHFLLYPNPWPKAAQLRRRWHGHPVWPALASLAQRLELRTNWRPYAEEFVIACGMAGLDAALDVPRIAEAEALSPHERKYLHSGHRLFRVRVPSP